MSDLATSSSREVRPQKTRITHSSCDWRIPCSLACMDFPTLLQRVRSEFNEMPGLRLTPAQAGRLLGLDAPSCQRVLNALVQSAFLRWTADGTVVRTES